MTDVAPPRDPDVKVAITLASIGYEGEGQGLPWKLKLMTEKLEHADLPTAGNWTITFGPVEFESDLWFVAEGPDSSGAPTLALVIRGTQMHRWASIKQDLELGLRDLPFPVPGADPEVKVSHGFANAFDRLVRATDYGGQNALGFLKSRLGEGAGPESIHVIGHSLGGALAPMVGIWVKTQFPARSVRVYPFGGQSTGNDRFVHLYLSTFPDQPSRWITSLDVTPLMFADLDKLKGYWPDLPPPHDVNWLVDHLRGWWSQYRSTPDACVFPAAMYMHFVDDPKAWTTQTHQQHEHKYYMWLAGVPLAAIRSAFGAWTPPPGTMTE
jgi:hypothetical protein